MENLDTHYYLRIHPLVDRAQQPLGAMLIFMDKTALLKKQNELEAIGLISRLCLNSEDVAPVYDQLPALLSKYFRFSLVAVDLVKQKEMVTVSAAGLEYDKNHPVRVPMVKSVSGEVISTQEPLVLTGGELKNITHPLLKDRNVKALICSPFRLQHESVGALVLADHRTRRDAHELGDALNINGHHLALEIERKRFARKLERQNETLQKMMNHIPVMLCFYDELGEISYGNQEFTRILGWSFENLKQIEEPFM